MDPSPVTSLGYTIIDDFTRWFDEQYATVPSWVFIAFAILLGFIFIYGVIKKSLILSVLALLAVAIFSGLWVYSAYFFD